MDRLATLIPSPDGITDIYRQTTYGGGIIPRLKGEMMIEELNAGRCDTGDRRRAYESVIIRLTGGFDD